MVFVEKKGITIFNHLKFILNKKPHLVSRVSRKNSQKEFQKELNLDKEKGNWV